MKELRQSMLLFGVTGDEIESQLHFNPRLFKECVPRRVPPASILYWQVRAVSAVYGPMIDSKTGKPFFNKLAWTKANNIFKEIRLGLCSDPPRMAMYTPKMKDGVVTRNRYDMEMIQCNHGTNRTQSSHKGLITTFGTWCTSIEISECLLGERRH